MPKRLPKSGRFKKTLQKSHRARVRAGRTKLFALGAPAPASATNPHTIPALADMDKSTGRWFIAPCLRRIYDWCIRRGSHKLTAL